MQAIVIGRRGAGMSAAERGRELKAHVDVVAWSGGLS